MMPPPKPLQAARWLAARLLLAVGVPLQLRSPDRDVLERQILPYFAAHDEYRNVLFVGCDWYTTRYERVFRNREYVTIEVDPARRVFGARRHIVGSMEDLQEHFPANTLDLILCNGVFGWGLDERSSAALAFASCREVLRPEGVLVLGWDDVPEHRPFDPTELEEFRRFSPWVFPPLNAARHVVDANRHVYDFLMKSQ
jgi:SAM-dependent methyltransferase